MSVKLAQKTYSLSLLGGTWTLVYLITPQNYFLYSPRTSLNLVCIAHSVFLQYALYAIQKQHKTKLTT